MPARRQRGASASSYRFTSFPVLIAKSNGFSPRVPSVRQRNGPKGRRAEVGCSLCVRRVRCVGSAMSQPSPAQSDRDLASIAEARALARRAKQAWLELAEFSQERIDAIVDAMANAATPCAEMFARLAVEETGYGVV